MFHGSLQAMVPNGIDTIDFAVKTVKECVEAVSMQIPAFAKGPRKVVQILGVQNEHDLLREDVDVVHIMPAFVGGKRGGLVQIILGTLLIAAAILLPGLGTIAGVSLNTILFSAGLSLTFSGIALLFAPKPPSNTPSANNSEGSKYLGAQGNTVKIGTRIPLGYGRQKVYGHILSFNVSAEQSLVDSTGGTKPTTSGGLSLSQGAVRLYADGSATTRTLIKAEGGTAPYTYKLSNVSSPLSFNTSTRVLSVGFNTSYGGRLCTYTVTDADMKSVSVDIAVSYDTTATGTDHNDDRAGER